MKEIAAESIKTFGNETHRALVRDGVVFHMIGKDLTHNFYMGNDMGDKQLLSVYSEALDDDSLEPWETQDDWEEGCYIGDCTIDL